MFLKLAGACELVGPSETQPICRLWSHERPRMVQIDQRVAGSHHVRRFA